MCFALRDGESLAGAVVHVKKHANIAEAARIVGCFVKSFVIFILIGSFCGVEFCVFRFHTQNQVRLTVMALRSFHPSIPLRGVNGWFGSVRPGLGGHKRPGIPLRLATARAVPTGYTGKKAPMFHEKCRASKKVIYHATPVPNPWCTTPNTIHEKKSG